MNTLQKYQQYINKKFNNFTILDVVFPSKNEHVDIKFKVICNCGNKKLVSVYNILNGTIKSCGCSSKKFRSEIYKSLEGQQFTRLTVIKKVEKPSNLKKQSQYWLCKCECGDEIICTTCNLNSGNTKSCGCLGFEHLNGIHYSERNKNLDRFRPLYSRINTKNISNIRKNKYKECIITLEDLNEQWDRQKGICPFTGVQLYIPDWVSKKDYIYQASLDRIDSTKGYEKGNIQFISVIMNYAKNDINNEIMYEFCKIITKNWKDKI